MSVSPLSVFASIAIIQILGWLSPGPNLIAVSGTSMSAGRRAGVATALGISIGVGLWALLAVFGVALLFEAFPALFIALKLAGAAFLCWLGWQSIQAAIKTRAGALSLKHHHGSAKAAFRSGFLVLMTNPKAPIFFGAVLTSYLPVDAPNWILAGIVVEFLVLSAILNSVTALAFSTRAVVDWFGNHQQHIRALFGAIFILLGLLIVREVALTWQAG